MVTVSPSGSLAGDGLRRALVVTGAHDHFQFHVQRTSINFIFFKGAGWFQRQSSSVYDEVHSSVSANWRLSS